MNNLLLRCIFTIAFLNCFNVLTAQTKTFDYLSSGMSTSACNVFSPAVTINGVTHQSHAGGVTFNTTNGLVLATNPQGSTPGATAFVIYYNFVPGKKYDIAITAIGDPSFKLEASVVPNLDQFNTNGTNLCVTDSYAWSYAIAGYGRLSTLTTNSSAIYTIPQFSIPGSSSYPYLIIWAQGGQLQLSSLTISKITITETIAPAFTIAASLASLNCGSTTPTTFTVSNSNNTQGVTGYNWNIGTTPNGWIYNGSAAPASIITSTNTLTLTPDCGKALSNISASASVAGQNYPTTNSGIISINQPAYSISGNSLLCSGNGTYTVNGLVCNSSVAWVAPPSNLGSLNSLTASPATLTYGGSIGNFNLTANITSCGIKTPVAIPVHTGAYTNSDYVLSPPNNPVNWCPNQTMSFGISGAGGTNYNWSLPSGWVSTYNGGSYIVVRTPPGSNPPTSNIVVNFTDPCGTPLSISKFLVYNSSICSTVSPYNITPNPATSYITIGLVNPQVYGNINAVQITDLSGTIYSNLQWPGTNQQVQVPVYFLQNGNYIARIYSGTQWYSNQFIVQH